MKEDKEFPTRIMIYRMQMYRCLYCRRFREVESMTWDHWIPRSLCTFLTGGGSHYWHRKRWNLVLACETCNTDKDNRLPNEPERMMYRFLLMREPPTLESLQDCDINHLQD